MRVNFSHATEQEFFTRQTNLRKAQGGQLKPIMLDTKGPEIRMGGLRVCKQTGNRKAKITLVEGTEIRLTTDPACDGDSDENRLFIGYEQLGQKLKDGALVLLDDGLVSLRVENVDAEGDVLCRVLNTSEIGERKGVNLPGIITDLPALSEKDKEDIRFGIEHDIDMVAASFVRSSQGVEQIRAHIADCHKRYSNESEAAQPLVISKIETDEALDNLEEIIQASDGIMIARGDLGVEVPIQEVATWQKMITTLCLKHGRPVIVATQMLDSMQSNPRPTRAEVADVTTAVLDHADAVMLSGESANGKYPDTSIAMQAAIVSHTEQWKKTTVDPSSRWIFNMAERPDFLYTPTASTVYDALKSHQDNPPDAILLLDMDNGLTSKLVSALRFEAPIVVFSSSLKVCRQLALFRGVHPVLVEGNFPEAASDGRQHDPRAEWTRKLPQADDMIRRNEWKRIMFVDSEQVTFDGRGA